MLVQRTAVIAMTALAIAWGVLGTAAILSAIERGTLSPATLGLLTALSIANLGALVLAAIATRSPRIGAHWFVSLVLVANVVTTFTDQFGLVDGLYLAACLLTAGMVALSWRRPNKSPVTHTTS